MDWKKFKQYYDNMSPVEEAVIRRRFNEYMEGNLEWDEANKPEIDSRLELFKCGWVALAIELEGSTSG